MSDELTSLLGSSSGGAKWKENPFYERLLKIRATNPKAWASISPAAKLSLHHYEAKKREALMLESMGKAEEADALVDRLVRDSDGAA